MENKWLVWFYKFCDIQKEDETDIEELMEMRFIEFLCRFFIMENRGQVQKENNKSSEKLPAFDCFDIKSGLVGKLEYLKNLRIEHISKIRGVMNYLMDHADKIKKLSDQLNIKFNDKPFVELGRGEGVRHQSIEYFLLEQCEV